MTHWRKLTPRNSQYVAAEDLDGKEVTLVIAKVEGGTIEGERGRKDKKAVVTFEKAKKPMVANATNCKTIATMYGDDVEQWVGKAITIYPTTTQMRGETVPCIRVRPRKPETNQ